MKIFGSINLIEWNPHTNTGPLSTTTVQLNRLGGKRVRWISTECPPSLSVRPLSGFKLSKRLLEFSCQVQSKNSEIQFRWISGHWRSEMQSVLHIQGQKAFRQTLPESFQPRSLNNQYKSCEFRNYAAIWQSLAASQTLAFLVGIFAHSVTVVLPTEFLRCLRQPVKSNTRNCSLGVDLPNRLANRFQQSPSRSFFQH